MIQSRFRFVAYFVALLGVLFAAAFIAILSGKLLSATFVFTLIFALFFMYMAVWFLFGELRTKAIAVKIDGSVIVKRGYLGLGRPKKFSFTDFDGFKMSTISSRGKDYEYFYLMLGDSKVIKLSAFYHENYRELKNKVLARKLKNLGTEYSTLSAEMIDIIR